MAEMLSLGNGEFQDAASVTRIAGFFWPPQAQKGAAARETAAATRCEAAGCSAAGRLPQHLHGRNPLWLHDPSVWLSSSPLR